MRISKHNISQITNKGKLESLDKLFIDYKLCLEHYIILILNDVLPLRKFASSGLPTYGNISHSWYKQLIYKQASEIIRSQIKKSTERRFKNYKRIYYYFFNKSTQSKFTSITFKELKLKNIVKSRYFIKPNLQKLTITLDERFFDIQQGKHFDKFIRITLPYFYKKKVKEFAEKIKVPLKHHKHSNSLLKDNYKERKCIQLKKDKQGRIFINLIYQKDLPSIKTNGKKLGLDIGYKKMIVTSNNQYIGSEMEQIYKNISKKKQGSKNFKQNLVYRDQMVNYFCNQLNLEDVNHLVIEDLKNVKHKSKLSTDFNNKLQRWVYPQIITKLTRICEANGIYLEKVSPEYTSQMCSSCGHVDKKSRQGEFFKCTCCDYECDADYNASINICNRGAYSPSNQESEEIHNYMGFNVE